MNVPTDRLRYSTRKITQTTAFVLLWPAGAGIKSTAPTMKLVGRAMNVEIRTRIRVVVKRTEGVVMQYSIFMKMTKMMSDAVITSAFYLS